MHAIAIDLGKAWLKYYNENSYLLYKKIYPSENETILPISVKVVHDN